MLRRGDFNMRQESATGRATTNAKLRDLKEGKLTQGELLLQDVARKFRNWARSHEKRNRVEDALRIQHKCHSRLEPLELRPLLRDLVPDVDCGEEQMMVVESCYSRAFLFDWGDGCSEQVIFAARCAQVLWYEEELIDSQLETVFEKGALADAECLGKLAEGVAGDRIPLDGTAEQMLELLAQNGTLEDLKAAVVAWLALVTLDSHRTASRRNQGLAYNRNWDMKNKAWRRTAFQERLVMESLLNWGLVRLLNYLMLFLFLYLVLEASQLKQENSDIRKILVDVFSLDKVAEITTLDSLKGYLTDVSHAIDIFSPLSGAYFGNDMSVRLIDGFENFASEQRRTGSIGDQSTLLDLPITPAFSFSAWVQIGRGGVTAADGANDRYIIRKRGKMDHRSSGLTCWGWKANGRLVFGAHDIGRWAGSAQQATELEFPSSEQVQAMAHRTGGGAEAWADLLPGNSNPQRMGTSSGRTLIAVSVNGRSVEFFIGGGARLPAMPGAAAVASSTDFNGGVPLQLPRDITDCASDTISFGDSRIGIAELVYYPRTLTRDDVQMILQQGGSNWAMGSNIRPDLFQRDAMQEVKVASREQSEQTVAEVVARAQAALASTVALRTGVQATSIRGYSLPEERLPGGNLTLDPVTQLQAFSLIEEPLTVVRESDGASLARWEPSPPSSTGGSTYAGWVRHEHDHGYFLVRALSATNPLDMCWGFVLYKDKIEWWMNPMLYDSSGRHTQMWQYGYITDPIQWSGEQWRHVALVLDAPSNRTAYGGKPCGTSGLQCGVHIYLDGSELPGTFYDYAGAPSLADYPVEDCPAREPSTVLLLGHRPGKPLQWQWRGAAMQTRYYHATALSPAQVLDLSMRSVSSSSVQPGIRPKPIRETIGCKFRAELLDSASWVDALGNGCAWYQLESKQHPTLCYDPEARVNCPVACQSSDLCFDPQTSAAGAGGTSSSTTIWNRVMLLDPSQLNSARTVICLRDDADASLRDVGLWRQLRPPQTPEDPAQPMQIDNSCSFNGSAIDAVADAYAETQEFMMHFWVRAVPSQVVPRFRPEIFFWRQLPRELRNESEPVSSNSGGRLGFPQGKPHFSFRTDSYMPGTVAPFHITQFTGKNCSWRAIEESAEVTGFTIPDDEWVFLVIGRTRDHKLLGMANSKGSVEPHPIWTQDGEGTGRDCIRGLIDAISVNQRMLISPITLSSKVLSLGDLQGMYYAERPHMETQVGPRIADPARLEYSHVRTVRRYGHRTMMLAPPILAQSLRPETACLGGLEEGVLSEFRSKAEKTRCQASFYKCPFFDEPDFQLFHCSDPKKGEALTPDTGQVCTVDGPECYFGRSPNQNGHYTEFLRTITDHDLVTRIGSLLKTDDFINERSQRLRLSLVFHSPEYGLTTLLEIEAQLSRAKVAAYYTVRHYYSLVKEEDWRYYVICQVACELFNLMLLYSTATSARALFTRIRRRRGHMLAGDSQKVIFTVYDFVLNVLIGGLAVTQIYLIFFARSRQEDIVQSLVSIPWGDMQNDAVNKNMVFNFLMRLQSQMDSLQRTENLAMSVLILLLIRVLTATNAHPRIAPLVKTMELAVDDLGHFMLVFCPCILLFAAVGSWRFGSENEDFETVWRAIATLWDTLLGPPDKMTISSVTDVQFVIFTFCYFLFVFFFFINFVLAIIVDAYTKVVDQLLMTPVEQSFPYDTCLAVRYLWYQLRHGWPSFHAVLECTEHLPISMEYVTVEDILPAFPERSRTPASLQKYVWHYDWDFLEPSYEGDYVPGHNKEIVEVRNMLQQVLLKMGDDNEAKGLPRHSSPSRGKQPRKSMSSVSVDRPSTSSRPPDAESQPGNTRGSGGAGQTVHGDGGAEEKLQQILAILDPRETDDGNSALAPRTAPPTKSPAVPLALAFSGFQVLSEPVLPVAPPEPAPPTAPQPSDGALDCGSPPEDASLSGDPLSDSPVLDSKGTLKL